MTTENKGKFSKALKSLLWRVGMMALAIVIKFLIDNLGLFNLPSSVMIVVGLVLGEISKIINKKIQEYKILAGKYLASKE